MQTIRRLYLYAVAFVSMETVLWGVIGLLRSIFAGEEIGGSVSRLAGALSLILVGVPVFLLHWWLAQRDALDDTEARSSRLRAVFLYGALLATLLPVVQNTLSLINRSFLGTFGMDTRLAMLGGNQTLGDNLTAIVLNGVLAGYIFSVLRTDWQVSPRGDQFPETRRLYRYLWMLYGLVMVIFGVQQVLQYILGLPQAVGIGTQSLLANGLTLLLVGTPLWFFVWRSVQLSLVEPAERQSLLRLVVLYLLAFSSVASVMISAGLVLDVVLRAVLGEGMSMVGFLAQISGPFSTLLPLGVVWAYYGRTLSAEMNAPPGAATVSEQAMPRRASLRRLYYYTLALFGLGAVFIGLQTLLSFILDLVLGETAVWGEAMRRMLSASLSTLVVGLPMWVLTWRPMILEASREDESGDHARRSVIRRGYLFLIFFTGVMGVMFSGGAMLFQVISAVLGEPPAAFLVQTLSLLQMMILFAFLLAYHWQTLRSDGRLAEYALAKRHTQFPVLVLTPDEGDFADSVVDALEREVVELPVAVHPFSQGVPDETLSAAKAVILPADLMAKPPESVRLWLQNFTGARLVVPTPAEGWHWIFGSGRSLTALARRTARIVRHMAEGEELPKTRESSPWLTVVYIFGGLFALQLLLGMVVLILSLILD